VVHAVPDDAWSIVAANASDEDMERVYAVLRSRHVLYGHIHTPFVRRLAMFTLVNTGAVSQSFDGDTRAAYALLEDDRVEIRRVEYDIEKEIRLLLRSNDPFAQSTAETLRTGRYVPISATSS
jgi:diadenosine tetraphosphatase ApaH/serine/threonine PP2A family protein phosphatase